MALKYILSLLFIDDREPERERDRQRDRERQKEREREIILYPQYIHRKFLGFLKAENLQLA